MNEESGIFWFSFRNLTRTISNIMALFTAMGDDFDEIGAAISALDTRVDAIEGQVLDPSVNTIYTYDNLLDSDGNDILDSDSVVCESTTIYDRR